MTMAQPHNKKTPKHRYKNAKGGDHYAQELKTP